MWCATLFVACVATLCGADIVFPGSRTSMRNASVQAQIPLDLMLRLSDVKDMSEFLTFVDEQSLESGIMNATIHNRFSDREEAAVVPKNAVCTPEIQVVELIKQKNASMLYFPTCARLEQCGGCCTSDLLKCQPTKSETVNYLVYVSQFAGSNKVSVREKIMVSVEKHTECRCKCAVKREDCHQLQVYEEDNCRCRCLNTEDEQRCRMENDTKIWDSKTCMCSCRQTQNCSTGYFYDLNTCSCAGLRSMRRRGVRVGTRRTPQRRIKPTMPLPVLPLQAVGNRWDSP